MTRTIPVVDDDRAVADVLLEALTEAGYAVRVAFGGQMAIEAVKRLPADLVVTDVRTPRMGVFDLVRHLRERNGPIPVLVLAGAVLPDFCPDVPAPNKPFDLDEVVGVIDRLLALASRAA